MCGQEKSHEIQEWQSMHMKYVYRQRVHHYMAQGCHSLISDRYSLTTGVLISAEKIQIIFSYQHSFWFKIFYQENLFSWVCQSHRSTYLFLYTITFFCTPYQEPLKVMIYVNINREKCCFLHLFTEESDEVAKSLQKKVRVLCWVMTNPNNHQSKAKHVKATWGKRCNVLLFMSSTEDPSLPSVALPVKEGRDNLWAKTKEAFKYIYKKHYDDADWFMKADDDTYVVVENLRWVIVYREFFNFLENLQLVE